MKSSPQKSLTHLWGNCFHGTNVSWNLAGDFRPERPSESLFSGAPAFSLSPPLCSRLVFSLSSTQTCGNEPTLQCSTSTQADTAAGRGGERTVSYEREADACFSWERWKGLKFLESFFFFFFLPAVLLLPLIFLAPLQSSAWCCFSRDIQTLDLRYYWDPLLRV